MAKREYINLSVRRPNLPFSDAVLVNDTLYISGRIGIDPATGLAAQKVERELELLFAGFADVLEQSGMSMGDLVWVQVFCPDVSLCNKFKEECVKHSSAEFPAGHSWDRGRSC